MLKGNQSMEESIEIFDNQADAELHNETQKILDKYKPNKD